MPIENSTYGQGLRSGVVNATVPGFQCVQGYPAWSSEQLDFTEKAGIVFTVSNRTQSEDCLRLDVIVPNSPTSSSLPVVVQIHGGGYTIGTFLSSYICHCRWLQSLNNLSV